MRTARARTLAAVALAWALAPAPEARALEPADPKANAKARAVLDYFGSLADKPEKRLVSGQFTNYGPGADLSTCEDAFKASGHWPAMVGLDYCDFGTGGLETKNVGRLALDYARRGGLVTISVHLPDPANPKGGGLRDKGVDLKTLLEPGTETARRWRKDLDTMADGLAGLRDAGVVVLWRPFHEMNGDWFWWGGKDPGDFVKVWKDMFDYYSKDKGLHNLLWVYSPNHGNKVDAYYPGDRYADLVGLDAYTDHVDPQHVKGYDAMVKLGKPFGFTEFGPHGPSDPPGDYDWPRFLSGVREHFPKAVFVQAWHQKWGLGRNRNAKAMLDDPWFVNREDLPKSFAADSKP